MPSERLTRATRRGRALAALAGAALLVLTPLRVVWGSEATGVVGPFVMWLAIGVLVAMTLRLPKG